MSLSLPACVIRKGLWGIVDSLSLLEIIVQFTMLLKKKFRLEHVYLSGSKAVIFIEQKPTAGKKNENKICKTEHSMPEAPGSVPSTADKSKSNENCVSPVLHFRSFHIAPTLPQPSPKPQ